MLCFNLLSLLKYENIKIWNWYMIYFSRCDESFKDHYFYWFLYDFYWFDSLQFCNSLQISKYFFLYKDNFE